ncbi:MAG TPA: alpha/beta hydrolase [Polyangiaceae bacterium]
MHVRLLLVFAAAVTTHGCHRQESRTDANFPVGSLSLHLICEGSGSPPVVLDSGLGNDAAAWSRVQPEVARFARVCSYDRAGLGASSPAPRPHSNTQMARELRSLLRAAKVAPPYVLVGHSMGGVNVQLLAKAHPKDVAGMVLVDTMTSDQPARFWALIPQSHLDEFRTGLRKLPEGIDFDTLAKGLTESKASPGWLHDKPLVVLTRGKEEGFPGASDQLKAQMLSAWQSAQAELPLFSSNRAHIVAKQSGHFIQHDNPALVVAAVSEVVMSVRSRRAVKQAAIHED